MWTSILHSHWIWSHIACETTLCVWSMCYIAHQYTECLIVLCWHPTWTRLLYCLLCVPCSLYELLHTLNNTPLRDPAWPEFNRRKSIVSRNSVHRYTMYRPTGSPRVAIPPFNTFSVNTIPILMTARLVAVNENVTTGIFIIPILLVIIWCSNVNWLPVLILIKMCLSGNIVLITRVAHTTWPLWKLSRGNYDWGYYLY